MNWKRIKEKKLTERVSGMASSEKLLSCAFLVDVLCSYRKDEEFGIMARCFNCPHYVRFIHEMDEADDLMMEKIDRIQRTGVWED